MAQVKVIIIYAGMLIMIFLKLSGGCSESAVSLTPDTLAATGNLS